MEDIQVMYFKRVKGQGNTVARAHVLIANRITLKFIALKRDNKGQLFTSGPSIKAHDKWFQVFGLKRNDIDVINGKMIEMYNKAA